MIEIDGAIGTDIAGSTLGMPCSEVLSQTKDTVFLRSYEYFPGNVRFCCCGEIESS